MDANARSRLNDAMARLADGDRAVFGEVFAVLRPLVESFAQKMLGSRAEADDATQQALIKLFERSHSFERGRDVVAWAFAICAWECRTIRRRDGRRREVDLDDASSLSPDGSPETDAIARDLEAAASHVLGMLSEADRETLRITLEDERASGVSLAAFRKRRERAFARLKEVWRRVYGSE